MKRLHFLINPTSGRGKGAKSWQVISQWIDKQGDVASTSITHHVITRESFDYRKLSPDTTLVCIGGDGSVHHSVHAATEFHLPLGIIPSGTGNDFATTMGIPNSPLEALELILRADPVPVDVVALNNQLIANVGGYGVDASVVHIAERYQWIKKIGAAGYAIAVPWALAQHRPFGLTAVVDGVRKEFTDVSMVAVANCSMFGGGMKIVPEATPFDGQIDLCVVSGINRLTLLWVFPRVYAGTHIGLPYITWLRGRTIDLEFDGYRGFAELDGEPTIASKSLSFSIASQPLQLLVPEATRERAVAQRAAAQASEQHHIL